MSKRRFEFVDGGSSKFWEIEVRGKQMSVCFGRIGTAGSTKDKSFGSPADAEREASKLVAEKTKKGYVEVAGKQSNGTSARAKGKDRKETAPPQNESAEATDLERVFTALDKALALKPNKAKVNVAPLTKSLGRAPHVELEALWKWGHASDVLEHEVLATVRGERDDWWWGTDRWFSPADSASELATLRELPTFPKTLVPIADDGAGNYTCHDLATGALVDWDHETRKAKRRPGTLRTIFEAVLKLADKEQRDEASAKVHAKVQSTTVKPGSLPKKLRPLPSPLVRSMNSSYREGFSHAAISSDATLLVGWTSGSHKLAFGNLAGGKDELVPKDPELQAFKAKMGFPPTMSATGIVIGGDRVVWVGANKELTLWSWKDGVLSMDGGGRSSAADFSNERQPRLREPWLVTMHYASNKVSLALWSTESLPRTSSLADANKRKIAPKALRSWPYSNLKLAFDVDSSGNVVYATSTGYQQWKLTYWQASTTNRVRELKLSDCDVSDIAMTADGERTFVLISTETGCELRVYNRDLELETSHPAGNNGWTSKQLRLSPTEDVLVSCIHHFDKAPELWVWNATTLDVLFKTTSKNKTTTLLHGVVGGMVVTTDPLTLYELC